MALVQQNFPAYLRTLRILFAALVMSQIMVLLVLYLVRSPETLVSMLHQWPWMPRVLPWVLLALVSASFFLFRKKLAEARVRADLKGKLTTYRVALLLRWAPLEVAILFFGVLYFVTGLAPFLYSALVLLLLFMVTQWPTRTNIVARLGLSTDEQSMLDDPNAVVSEISQRPG